MATNVRGSTELTPKSRPLRKRVGERADGTDQGAGQRQAHAAGADQADHVALRAPSAMRMPISLVRCATA